MKNKVEYIRLAQKDTYKVSIFLFGSFSNNVSAEFSRLSLIFIYCRSALKFTLTNFEWLFFLIHVFNTLLFSILDERFPRAWLQFPRR